MSDGRGVVGSVEVQLGKEFAQLLEMVLIMCWTVVGEGWVISNRTTFWLSICGWGGDSVVSW